MISWLWLIPAVLIAWYLGWLKATRSETLNLRSIIRRNERRRAPRPETAGNCGETAGRVVRVRTGELRRSIHHEQGGIPWRGP